jgi:hypothetical protein
MGLRPTKGDNDGKWGGPAGACGTPWTGCWDFIYFISGQTRASAADQGVRPTCVFEGMA